MILKIENLKKTFGEKIIYDNFNLEIPEKEFLVIRGRSGSGKSTLLNIIGLLDEEYKGSIELCGVKNPKINSKAGRKLLKEELVYLFQNYGLVDNETIYDNLEYVCKPKSKKDKILEIKKILKKVGLNNQINQNIYELSGGEQQRVALAKVLLKEANIILCDEPTGNLDEENSRIILDLLDQEYNRGKTVIVVSHEEIVEEYATKVINIDKLK